MTAPTVGPLLIDSEGTMPRTRNLHDEVLKDWEAAGKIAQRVSAAQDTAHDVSATCGLFPQGSSRTTFWEACGSGVAALAVAAVLVTAMVVLYTQTDALAALSLPLFAVVVAVLGVLPCAVLVRAAGVPRTCTVHPHCLVYTGCDAPTSCAAVWSPSCH